MNRPSKERRSNRQRPRQIFPIFCALCVLLAIMINSQPAYGVIEIGIGALVPTGIETETSIYLVPNASFALGLLGISVDLWVLPGNSKYFLLPYLQINLPVPIFHPYAAVGITFAGDANGLSFIPPRGQMNVKVGASSSILTQGRIYAELMASYVPATETFSQLALVAGVRVGF